MPAELPITADESRPHSPRKKTKHWEYCHLCGCRATTPTPTRDAWTGEKAWLCRDCAEDPRGGSLFD